MKYGRYEIIKELGKGSMGMVYLAHDPNINRDVALKILRPDRVESADFVQRFLKEARAIGRLAHQNIVTVYDVGEDQGTVFIAMELIQGTPLNVYAKDKKLSVNEIVEMGIQVASSLDYAHSKGIVHRDIKPPNIMITPDGQAKITDFGIAHIDDPEATQQTQAGEILGTPNYMSPEQVLGKKVDGRSDLFSLGVILYELAGGLKPFKGDNLGSIFNSITSTEPEKISAVNPEIPLGLSDIIMKSIAKEPEARYQTGKEIAGALSSLLQGAVDKAGTDVGKKKIKWGVIAGVGLAAVVLIAAVLIFALRNDEKQPISDVLNPLAAKAGLDIESEPTGAQIFIDGKAMGASPQKIMLPFGQHEVRLSLNGYYEWEAQVNLDKKGDEPLRVTLEPIEGKPVNP